MTDRRGLYASGTATVGVTPRSAPPTDSYAGLGVEDDPYAGLGVEAATPMIWVNAKDRSGKKIRFQLPRSSTDAEVMAAVRKNGGNPNAHLQRGDQPAPPPPPRTWGQFASKEARDVLSGVGKAADFAGRITGGSVYEFAPVAIKDLGANLATGASNAIGLAKPQDTAADRVGSAVTEAVAGAAIPAAGLESVGGRLASGVARRVIPQLVGAATSGGAGQIAKEVGAPPVVQTLAALAGGIIPGGGAALARQGTAAVLERLRFAPATTTAARTLKSVASAPEQAAANITTAEPSASGALPTLAEVAKDPGLAVFQRRRISIPINERMDSNAAIRGRAAETALGTGDPQAVQNAALAQQEQSASSLAAGRAAIGPVADRAASGGVARESFGQNYQAAKDRVREAYNVPALTESAPVDIPRPLVQDMLGRVAQYYGDGAGQIPPKLQTILNEFAAPAATTQRFANIDRRLADFAGEAKVAGRAQEAAVASSLRQSLGAYVESSMPQPYRDALAQARAMRAEQGRIYENGTAPKAFESNQFGNPVHGDTEVPTRIVAPGPKGGDTAEGLTAAIGPQASEQAAREEFRRLVDGKELETGAAVKGLSMRYAETLARYPSLQKDMDVLHDRAALNDAFLASPLGKMANADVDPSSAIASMFKPGGERRMAVLVNQIRDNPDALDGLRRSFAGFIRTKGAGGSVGADGANIPSIDGTREAINTVLDMTGGTQAITTQQRIVLQRIRDELNAANFAANKGRAANVSGAQEQDTFAKGLPLPGTAGKVKNLLGYVFGTLSNQAARDALIEQAILDPKLAAKLLARPTPDRARIVMEQISANMRGAAAGAAISSQDEGQQQ